MNQVLIVESHELLRSALKDLLAARFDSILEACDPVEAVQHAVRESPRTIVLDTLVPEMEWFSLSQMLREISPGSLIVLLLDKSDAQYEQAAAASGANGFVVKSEVARQLPLLLEQWDRGPGRPRERERQNLRGVSDGR